MSDEKGQDRTARIGLSRPSGGGRLELKKTVETGMVRQSFSHGRSKAVAVEVKKTRTPVRPFGPPASARRRRGGAAPGGAAAAARRPVHPVAAGGAGRARPAAPAPVPRPVEPVARAGADPSSPRRPRSR